MARRNYNALVGEEMFYRTPYTGAYGAVALRVPNYNRSPPMSHVWTLAERSENKRGFYITTTFQGRTVRRYVGNDLAHYGWEMRQLTATAFDRWLIGKGRTNAAV